MDAKAIIPTGWHFVSHFCEPDGVTRISPLERRNFPVRYYFVGFGNAYHLPNSTKPHLVTDIGGEDEDVPELRGGHQYNPFKLDIYTLGNVFKKELYNVGPRASLRILQSRLSHHGLRPRNTMVSISFRISSYICMWKTSLNVRLSRKFFRNGTKYDLYWMKT